MKVQVDIFTGFLGSGKTSLINEMLASHLFFGEKILVIQWEVGEEEVREDLLKRRQIWVKKLGKGENFEAEQIKEMIEKLLPDRIIIEQNGMSGLEDLLNKFSTFGLGKLCRINKILHVADARRFEMLMQNLGSKLVEQIVGSELFVLNFSGNLAQERINSLKRKIKEINKSVSIICIVHPKDFCQALEKGTFYQEKVTDRRTKSSNKLAATLFFCILAYLLVYVLKTSFFSQADVDLSGLRVFNTIFISILMQAFPFLLIGAFLSSLIQVFISGDSIARFFSQNKVISLLMAVFGGIFFPVCDCAIIPVVVRLIKKGVPLPAALTFLLAAPTVNPIVVASTYYAFPDQPMVVLVRLVLGIVIALTVGLAFSFYPWREDIILNRAEDYLCGCTYCQGNSTEGRGFFRKLPVIFRHAGAEFIDVGRFLIMGAFLTSLVQTFVPREILFSLAGDRAVSLAVMMGAAFVLSVCSTSDAFIGRSFSVAFPVDAVMGFLVLGPMMDLKNLLVLFGSLRKGFVIRLVFFIMALSYILLYFVNPIIFYR